MHRLAEICERIAATTKKIEKTAIVAEYFRSRDLRDAVISAVFLSGRAFPAFDERTLQIGGALLWKLVVELAGTSKSPGESAEKQIPRRLNSTPTSAKTALVGGPGSPARDDKIITGSNGAAEQAAEKRLKQVNSAFCATTIQQLTSDFLSQKRPKLLLWFFFQQPV